MPHTAPVTVDPPCARCDGTRVIPLTFGDRQTGYDQPGFKCPDCGARFLTLHNQRLPRPI
jgi:DNA-directed RNA polymerase subunit RPC12/RpoP